MLCAFLHISLASIIEGHWRVYILWLLVIGFNPYNVYALLYGAPAYCDVSISPYLGYWIRAYIRLLILICFFLRNNNLSRILYLCGLQFLFSIWLLSSIIFCLRSLIASQSSLNEVFNIMSRPKTNWPGVDYSVVWYVLRTAKDVAANISDQGSSSPI